MVCFQAAAQNFVSFICSVAAIRINANVSIMSGTSEYFYIRFVLLAKAMMTITILEVFIALNINTFF